MVVVPVVVIVIVDLTGPVVVAVEDVVAGLRNEETMPVLIAVPEEKGPVPLTVDFAIEIVSGRDGRVLPVPVGPGMVEFDKTDVGDDVALVVFIHPPLQLVMVTVEVVRVVLMIYEEPVLCVIVTGHVVTVV